MNKSLLAQSSYFALIAKARPRLRINLNQSGLIAAKTDFDDILNQRIFRDELVAQAGKPALRAQ